MIKAGDAVTAIRSQRQLQIREVGLMLPERHKIDRLVQGQARHQAMNSNIPTMQAYRWQ